MIPLLKGPKRGPQSSKPRLYLIGNKDTSRFPNGIYAFWNKIVGWQNYASGKIEKKGQKLRIWKLRCVSVEAEKDSPDAHTALHDESSHRFSFGSIIVAGFFDVGCIFAPGIFSAVTTPVNIGTGNLPNVLPRRLIRTTIHQLEFFRVLVFIG